MNRSNSHGIDIGTRALMPALCCALACSIAVPETARALDPDKSISQYIHRLWTSEDGLPQMSVLTILQSQDSYIWLGTQQGIARFDGVKFTVFDKSNTATMLNEAVTSIAQLSDGTLWFGTEIGGLLRYCDGDFARLTTRDGLCHNEVRALAVGDDDSLWIGTSNGLSRYSNGRFETFYADDGLPHRLVDALAFGPAGLWIGTKGGLARLAGERIEPVEIANLIAGESIKALCVSEGGTLWVGTNGQGLVAYGQGRSAHYRAADGLGDDQVASLLEDPDGALWIGTVTGGLVRHTRGEFSRFTARDGLNNNWVHALATDREGNLWVGTHGGGLSRFRDGKITPFGEPEGLTGIEIRSIIQDAKGAIWFGTTSGLDRFEDGQRTAFHGEELLDDKMIMGALEDSSGRLWFGTRTAGLWRFDRHAWRHFSAEDCLPDVRATGLTERDDGSIWLGTPSGLVRIEGDECTTISREQGLPVDSVKFAFEDSRGELWLGTFGAGVLRFAAGEVAAIEPPGGVSEDQKLALAYLEDRQGTLWFGTTGGLLRVQRDGSARFFTEADGLHGYAVLCILDDEAGNLWISSNRGIYRVSKQELEDLARGLIARVSSESYDADDGMRSSECVGGTPPACWKTTDGRLWFGTINGAAIVEPDSMPRNEILPPVVIETVLFDGKPAVGKPPHVARAGTRKLEFGYAAISFVAPEKLPFRYMLEGFDTGWVDAGPRRVAYYTSIPPGDYRFRVKAANSDGLWNEVGASVSFTLEPLFHQTLAFRVLLGLGLVLLGLAVAGLRIRQFRLREKELVAAVEARTADLRELTEELLELSLKDPLTGLRNRRFLFETLPDLFESLAAQYRAMATLGAERRSSAGEDVFAVFMVDIDHFKRINDTWGHDAGDRVLVQLAQVLSECTRADDVLVRWGGEEFLIVLPRTDMAFPERLAERIRSRIADTAFELLGGESIHATCSVGLATFPFFDDGPIDVDFEQLITLADFALLSAKHAGRNLSMRTRSGDGAPASHAAMHQLVADLGSALEAGLIRLEAIKGEPSADQSHNQSG